MRRIFSVSLPFLVCNFPLSEKMVLFTEKEHEKMVLPLLCDALETIAGQQKTWGILITSVPHGLEDLFTNRGFSIMDMSPTTYLDVVWETFPDYLKSLPRKAKKNIRHTLNQGKRKGLTLEHSQDLSGTEHLYELFRGAMERHGHAHIIPCTLDVFKNFQKYVGEYTYVVRCFRGEDLLGYWMYFFDGDTASLAISGIDQSYSKEYNTYFNICYDTIRELIEKGCKRAWFGVTTYEVKRRIGCTLKKSKAAAKLRNPVLNYLVRPLLSIRNMQVKKEYQE
jgi:predicted N-acyltransferase